MESDINKAWQRQKILSEMKLASFSRLIPIMNSLPFEILSNFPLFSAFLNSVEKF